MTVRQAGGALPTHLGEAGLDFRKAVASEQGQCIGASAEAVGDTGKEAAERSPEVDEEVSMTMDENRFWFPAAISCRSPSDFGPSAAKALKGCSRVLVETSSTLPVQTGKRGTDVVSWRYAPAVRWPGSDASNDRRKPGQTVSNPTTWGAGPRRLAPHAHEPPRAGCRHRFQPGSCGRWPHRTLCHRNENSPKIGGRNQQRGLLWWFQRAVPALASL